MLTQESIEKLNRLLGLQPTGFEQDWEIELADAGRIEDFVRAYVHESLGPADRFALMALILASTDSFIATEGRLPEAWKKITDLLVEDAGVHSKTVSYWCCEGEDDPAGWFHLTPHIRSVRQR